MHTYIRMHAPVEAVQSQKSPTKNRALSPTKIDKILRLHIEKALPKFGLF